MPFNMRNQSLSSIKYLTQAQIKFILRLSSDLKSAKYSGTEEKKSYRKKYRIDF